MSIRIPLAGDNPRKAKQFDREEAEERAFRMLSEGEVREGGFEVFSEGKKEGCLLLKNSGV